MNHIYPHGGCFEGDELEDDTPPLCINKENFNLQQRTDELEAIHNAKCAQLAKQKAFERHEYDKRTTREAMERIIEENPQWAKNHVFLWAERLGIILP